MEIKAKEKSCNALQRKYVKRCIDATQKVNEEQQPDKRSVRKRSGNPNPKNQFSGWNRAALRESLKEQYH